MDITQQRLSDRTREDRDKRGHFFNASAFEIFRPGSGGLMGPDFFSRDRLSVFYRMARTNNQFSHHIMVATTTYTITSVLPE